MSGAREQVSRLLALVPYLQTRTDVSLAQVAADFGVRPDQIMKDLKVLWMCGLPGLTPDKMIEVDFEAIEDDPDGVVRIDNADFLSRPVRLGSSEASALIVALRALREGSPEASHEVIDRCLVKLEDADGERHGHRRRSRCTCRGRPWPSGTRRCWPRRSAATGRPGSTTTCPPATRPPSAPSTRCELLASEGHDYLDAWCHLAQARRLFRLDRMHAVEIVDEPRQEHDLTPRDLSDGLFEPGPDDVEAVLHLERYARWVADYYPVDSVEELGEGRLVVTPARRRPSLAGPAGPARRPRPDHRGTGRAGRGGRAHGAGHAGPLRPGLSVCHLRGQRGGRDQDSAGANKTGWLRTKLWSQAPSFTARVVKLTPQPGPAGSAQDGGVAWPP